MASQKNQNDDAKIDKIHDVVTENYTKLSDELARSQQQHAQAFTGKMDRYGECNIDYTDKCSRTGRTCAK